MKNKCCFIIPYFGKIPNYFELFLKSCETNHDFTWLIFTDDKKKYKYPKNVKVFYTDFLNLKDKIQAKFDFNISLSAAYKLCDFKPAYGYIFDDYIKEYDFWGYCDLDMIMGDLGYFITDDLLKEYDKLFALGHLTLFRNNFENNTLFMKEVNGEFWYKEVYSTEKNMIFDENYHNKKNIHKIFLAYNKNVYEDDLSINPLILPTRFIKATYYACTDSFILDERESLYTWQNGHVYRYLIENEKLLREEYLYMHLQERKMKLFDKSIIYENEFKIIPNKFEKLEYDSITLENFKDIKKNTLCFHYFQYHIKWKYRGAMRKINKAKRLIGGEKIE